MNTAYVVFEDSPAIWTRMCRKHFRHVSVIIPLPQGHIHIDPRARAVDYTYIPEGELNKMYDRSLYHDIRILKVKMNKNELPHVPMLYTCVEIVKRSLGINKWWIVTPNQLYKYLIKEI